MLLSVGLFFYSYTHSDIRLLYATHLDCRVHTSLMTCSFLIKLMPHELPHFFDFCPFHCLLPCFTEQAATTCNNTLTSLLLRFTDDTFDPERVCNVAIDTEILFLQQSASALH